VFSPSSSSEGRRIVICDYNALLLSVTGLLRMSGYCVFQAHDGQAARELCHELPDIELLVLNTTGTGTDTPSLVRAVRADRPGLAVLHIGASVPEGLPDDVPTLAESFSADELLKAVGALLPSTQNIPRSLPELAVGSHGRDYGSRSNQR
jgi:DNA-binding response OmpR family regulator